MRVVVEGFWASPAFRLSRPNKKRRNSIDKKKTQVHRIDRVPPSLILMTLMLNGVGKGKSGRPGTGPLNRGPYSSEAEYWFLGFKTMNPPRISLSLQNPGYGFGSHSPEFLFMTEFQQFLASAWNYDPPKKDTLVMPSV